MKTSGCTKRRLAGFTDGYTVLITVTAGYADSCHLYFPYRLTPSFLVYRVESILYIPPLRGDGCARQRGCRAAATDRVLSAIHRPYTHPRPAPGSACRTAHLALNWEDKAKAKGGGADRRRKPATERRPQEPRVVDPGATATHAFRA